MKKNKMKKYLVIMMAFVLILPLLPASANLAEANSGPLLGNSLVKKPSEAGKLQLVDWNGQKTLADQNGNPIQLRGMSTHGLQWFGEIVNNNAFAALANDWESNMIRLAMYIGENGYYYSPEVKDLVYKGIDLAIANDMYVIVDWHVHSPGDPRDSIYAGAMDFFKEIAAAYPNNPHLIYELANEPSSAGGDRGIPNNEKGWEAVKEYADPIVKMLRESGHADDNIILVGSPNWSQRPDLAADNPIDDHHTMYSLHFYTGTHQVSDLSYPTSTPNSARSNVMSNARYALENGVALFATEWGTSQADGNNGPYLAEADAWLTFLNENNISWANWSLTNKNETSGSFTPFQLGKTDATDLDPGSDQVWSPEELSASGEYVRARIKGIPYEPIDRSQREGFTEIIWDFADGTTQGFRVNNDSPVKDGITLTNVDNRLQISGLSNSNDVSPENYWANVRLSADGFNPSVDIFGAETLTMDVIVTEPTTVSIAAIPQNSSHGWANPNQAIIVTAEDFELQGGGVGYRATVTITKEDSPTLGAIGSDTGNSMLENLILFIGTENADSISLDNITVFGNRAMVEAPIEHAPQGTATMPSSFEDGTRQGWDWAGGSGVKTELTIEKANGSNALSFEFAYPEVKPSDDWATAPRIQLKEINATRGSLNYLAFDLYMDPIRASEGSVIVNLAMAPPALGFWAQGSETFVIDLSNLDQYKKTADGLYHFEVVFDMNKIADGKVIEVDTGLRDIEFIIIDGQSDFAGRLFIDNVKFTNFEDDEETLSSTPTNEEKTEEALEAERQNNEKAGSESAKEVTELTNEEGHKLPNTATNLYNTLLFGILTLAIGIVVHFVRKRRTSSVQI